MAGVYGDGGSIWQDVYGRCIWQVYMAMAEVYGSMYTAGVSGDGGSIWWVMICEPCEYAAAA